MQCRTGRPSLLGLSVQRNGGWKHGGLRHGFCEYHRTLRNAAGWRLQRARFASQDSLDLRRVTCCRRPDPLVGHRANPPAPILLVLSHGVRGSSATGSDDAQRLRRWLEFLDRFKCPERDRDAGGKLHRHGHSAIWKRHTQDATDAHGSVDLTPGTRRAQTCCYRRRVQASLC